MKRLTSLILVAVAGTALPALAQNTVNPLSFLVPSQANPWSGGYGSISSPFGLGALNPLNPLNSINPLSPWNNYGGMSNPVLSLGALGAINALTPNLLPGNNPFAGNPFGAGAYQGAPYQGNPFAGSPYMRQSQQPYFGTQGFSPSMPSFPNMPFAVQQPQNMAPAGYYPMQQQPVYPYMPYGAQQQSQPVFPNFFAATQPAPKQQPAPTSFFGMTQHPQQPAPQSVPQAASFLPFLLPPAVQPPATQPPAAKPSQATPDFAKAAPSGLQLNALPFFQFVPQTPSAAAAPASAPPAPVAAQPAAADAKSDNAAPMPPLDPAAFMQMYMKPDK